MLGLTVEEALELFADRPRLCARLRPPVEVGLGYLTLSQPTATLSGGEVQRLKLAAALPCAVERPRGRAAGRRWQQAFGAGGDLEYHRPRTLTHHRPGRCPSRS